MRRHLSWILPLLFIPATYVAFAGLVWWASTWSETSGAGAFWALTVMFLAFIAGVVTVIICIVRAIRNGRRVYRSWQRGRGRYNTAELAELSVQDAHREAWARAQALVADVRSERLPQPIQVWGVIPRPNEQFFFDVDAQYERFFGSTVEYTQRSGFYVGRPSFVFAGLALDSIANASARTAAARQAAAQWRERQQTRVLVSNQRLVIQVNGQWLSFDHLAITACHPDPEHWCVVYEYSSAVPLRLVGKGAPLIAVWTTLATQGRHAVEQHPHLASLR